MLIKKISNGYVGINMDAEQIQTLNHFTKNPLWWGSWWQEIKIGKILKLLK